MPRQTDLYTLNKFEYLLNKEILKGVNLEVKAGEKLPV